MQRLQSRQSSQSSAKPQQVLRIESGFRRKARFAPTFKHAKVNVMGITPSIMTRWVPILGFWSIGAGAGLALYLSDMSV
jgi:hypothetical protein